MRARGARLRVLFLTARPARGPTASRGRALPLGAGAPPRAARAARAATPTPPPDRPRHRHAQSTAIGYKLPMGPVFTTTHVDAVGAARGLGGASRLFKERQLGAIAARFGGGGGRGTGRLYAGFGNKDKDVYAYVAAGIEPRHTFIDPASTIQICLVRIARPPAADTPARRRRRRATRRRRAGARRPAQGCSRSPVLFPPHCSEGGACRSPRFAAIAAQHLPNGFSRRRARRSSAPPPRRPRARGRRAPGRGRGGIGLGPRTFHARCDVSS